MDKTLILAVAGAGKTTEIINNIKLYHNVTSNFKDILFI